MKNKNISKERRGGNYERVRRVYERRVTVGVLIILIGILFLILPSILFLVGIIILIFIGLLEIFSEFKRIKKEKLITSPKILALVSFSVYFCLSLLAFYYLRSLENGMFWVLLPLVAAGMFDSSAHFVGKIFGKRKIASKISPNKTIEGTFAGFVVSIVSVTVMMLVASNVFNFGIGETIFFGFILASCAFFGDLIESFVKRMLNIKDFGNLLQKHGGLLDRVDSALLVVFGVLLIRHLSFYI